MPATRNTHRQRKQPGWRRAQGGCT
jgi:hypothetical protein